MTADPDIEDLARDLPDTTRMALARWVEQARLSRRRTPAAAPPVAAPGPPRRAAGYDIAGYTLDLRAVNRLLRAHLAHRGGLHHHLTLTPLGLKVARYILQNPSSSRD